MAITHIDHINLSGSAALIDACRAFYVDILGLRDGVRPPFRSRGYWLYAGAQPVVHLTVRERDETSAPDDATSSFDHYAFACEDAAAMRARLQQAGIAFEADEVPETGDVQFFLRDPAGIGLELNFRRR
ncbi:MAG: VOC family protein [Acidobacteria bacterium]|nr:VOC family protein [Acidobacteriota bacterium]MBV9477768.1 VOC family protein [Acidobacteriota bacterium]